MRFGAAPTHLKNISIDIMSYDNMHNPVGHFKSFFFSFYLLWRKKQRSKSWNALLNLLVYLMIFLISFINITSGERSLYTSQSCFQWFGCIKKPKKLLTLYLNCWKRFIYLITFTSRFSKGPTIRKAQMCKLFHENFRKELAKFESDTGTPKCSIFEEFCSWI